jgi:heme/copper-type cytochrome/quinol oxidase subunit 1
VHDQNRTAGGLGARGADRAEQQPREPAVATTTDDEQCGIAAEIQQHLRWLALAGDRLQLVRAVVAGHVAHRGLKCLDGFTTLNTISTIFSFVLGASMIPFLFNVVQSWKHGRLAVLDDPWGHGNSLEWATSSPPPRHNFLEVPRIRSERPAFEAHYPHLVERLRAEAHAGQRHEPYAGELIADTGSRQGPGDPDPT